MRTAGIWTVALVTASVAISVPAHADDPEATYGQCVAAGKFAPSDGEWGPFNEELWQRTTMEGGEGTYTGSPRAWMQSDGHSRFPDGQFDNCYRS